ncbi:hypothetical protein LIA77_05252 [Sarocladium implicatum]|nr:hypothetical protein LIA77_05252 [Sarocladium implicatum]
MQDPLGLILLPIPDSGLPVKLFSTIHGASRPTQETDSVVMEGNQQQSPHKLNLPMSSSRSFVIHLATLVPLGTSLHRIPRLP